MTVFSSAQVEQLAAQMAASEGCAHDDFFRRVALVATDFFRATQSDTARIVGRQGGRPAVLQPCQKCGAITTARERQMACERHKKGPSD